MTAKKEPTYDELLERIKALEEKSNEPKLPDTPQSPEVKQAEEYLSEKVKVKLFRDNDKYKDDVFVGINGKGILIKRGEEVEIERRYALLLDQAQIQTLRAAELMESEQKRFAEQNK